MVYSPAITITLSVHPRHRVPLNPFRPLRVVPLISPFSSRLVVPSISLLLFLFSPSLRFFVRIIPSPLVPPPFPRSSYRVDHSYPAIVFDLSCSCCGCRRTSRAFHYRVLHRDFSSFLTLFRSSFRCTSLSPLCCSAPGWYPLLDPSHLLSDFPSPFSFSKWVREFMRRN